MPKKVVLVVTCSSQKRMDEELATHIPVKKRVATMKELVEEFNIKRKQNSNETRYFNQIFYS